MIIGCEIILFLLEHKVLLAVTNIVVLYYSLLSYNNLSSKIFVLIMVMVIDPICSTLFYVWYIVTKHCK